MNCFETAPNSKTLQTTTEMWLLEDFKIQIAQKHCGKRLKCVHMEEQVDIPAEKCGWLHQFLCPRIERLGAYCFTVVCLSIRLSVCTNLT